MPSIKIIATPPGEAPAWVREAWVGLIMPVAEYDEPPATIIGARGGEPCPENKDGYEVTCHDARHALLNARKRKAVNWWDHESRAPTADSHMFGKKFCEYIP